MSDLAGPVSAGATVAISVHGAAGVLDLLVPEEATPLDVAKEYAAQTGSAGVPLMQDSLGRMLGAREALVDLGVQSGDVLVAAHGVHRAPGQGDAPASRAKSEGGALPALIGIAAAVASLLGGWYAARAGDDVVRTVTVGVLLACALLAALPLGRHRTERTAVAPAFAASAALAALYVPDALALPAVLASCGLAAAVVAGVSRALTPEVDEVHTVWIASGLTVLVVCAASPMFAWDPQVSWTVLLFLAMMATRFAPSLAIDVPDEALLELDKLAVTAWSARDQRAPAGKRGRIVVAGAAMSKLVRRASRMVVASAVAVLVVVSVATPLLLDRAQLDLDRIGARCLAFFVGASILLAARSYRNPVARAILSAAGLVVWVTLAVHLAPIASVVQMVWFIAVVVLIGVVVVVAAVATGRGWRSVWWSRRAEVAEALCGSFALAAAVVAAGIFRRLWEITS